MRARATYVSSICQWLYDEEIYPGRHLLVAWIYFQLATLVYGGCVIFRLEHFISRGSPLKGLSKYSDQESQERRYAEAVRGFHVFDRRYDMMMCSPFRGGRRYCVVI